MTRRLLKLPAFLWNWFTAGAARNAQNVLTALVQIWANMGRSILTTLGIIIAVTSIIVVISFVEGFGGYMTDMVRGYGTQYMVVRPWQPRGQHRHGMGTVRLDLADIEAVRGQCKSVHRLSPFVYTHKGEVIYGQEKAEEIPVRGVSEHYQTIRQFYVDEGRFFGPVDITNAAQVVERRGPRISGTLCALATRDHE